MIGEVSLPGDEAGKQAGKQAGGRAGRRAGQKWRAAAAAAEVYVSQTRLLEVFIRMRSFARVIVVLRKVGRGQRNKVQAGLRRELAALQIVNGREKN